MIKISSLRITLYLIFIFFSFIVIFWGAGFKESQNIPPNSLSSFFTISSLLKGDVIEEIGIVENFHYSAGDGPKPPSEAVVIQFTKNKKSVLNKISKYLISKDFEKIDSYHYFFKDQKIEITFNELLKKPTVTIRITYF